MVLQMLIRFYRWLRTHKRRLDRYTRWPPIGAIDFGDLRRVRPLSKKFGVDRGLPIDRYYIESFLKQHSASIQGRVLEIGDPGYTRKFGGDKVTQSEVLDVSLK